ncbi:phosphoenolpyruvate carboxylase [Pseudonocardia sp. MCCB 268]|nr:phosphoenolpyruvate carboxylase [Pseudonocardia cytotoxica]
MTELQLKAERVSSRVVRVSEEELRAGLAHDRRSCQVYTSVDEDRAVPRQSARSSRRSCRTPPNGSGTGHRTCPAGLRRRGAVADLAVIDRSLRAPRYGHIADGTLAHVLRVASVLELHLARLDVREHSAVHHDALAELYDRVGTGRRPYRRLDEHERQELLSAELRCRRTLAPRTEIERPGRPGASDVRRDGRDPADRRREAANTCIISMCPGTVRRARGRGAGPEAGTLTVDDAGGVSAPWTSCRCWERSGEIADARAARRPPARRRVTPGAAPVPR